VAADLAVIAAAQEAPAAANKLVAEAQRRGFSKTGKSSPWLMVSLNDGEDPHFRKAEFNRAECPKDCTRPCESICPAQAIVLTAKVTNFLEWWQIAAMAVVGVCQYALVS
jgi:Fe-S-cluster-containing hydrogenase component 2